MGVTIIKDRKSIGNTPNIDLDATSMGVLAAIQGGNSAEMQNGISVLNALLQPLEKEVERKDGTALPVKVSNHYFMKGGISTDAPEFKEYKDKFDMNRSVGWNVVAFNYDSDTVLAAKRGDIDIDGQKLKAVREVTNVYSKKYLPFSRLKAMITGGTEVNSIISDDGGATSGAAAFARGFGWARGEDYSDFITIVDGDDDGTRNFYRTTKATALSTNDVDDLVDAIRATNHYSEQGIIAIAHPRTLKNYAKLAANDTVTQDDFIFAGQELKAVNIDGVNWISAESMHKDFVLFYDAGMMEELLIRGVEAGDVMQRGLGIIYENNLESWTVLSDLDGAKMRIFPEEWYMPMRLSGGILDVSGTRNDASGFMQDGAGGSIEALEAFVAKLDVQFGREE